MTSDHNETKEAATGVSPAQALLIVLSILVTMVLYVGIWETKLADQEKELARVTSENQAARRRVEEIQKRIRSLSAALAETEKGGSVPAQTCLPPALLGGSDDE